MALPRPTAGVSWRAPHLCRRSVADMTSTAIPSWLIQAVASATRASSLTVRLAQQGQQPCLSWAAVPRQL